MRRILGIDPSFGTMGVAIKDPSKKYNQYKMFTGDFVEVIGWLGQNCKMKEVIAVVENPALDSAVFGAWEQMDKAIKTNNRGSMKFTFNTVLKRAQHVGENKAAAKLIIKMLSDKGVPVIEVAPSARQKAFEIDKQGKKVRRKVKMLRAPTKTTKEEFAELTGVTIKEGNTEHSRDAATLLHGRGIKWAEIQLKLQEKPKERKRPKQMPNQSNYNYHIINRKNAKL